MKKILIVLLLLTPAMMFAQSAFTGTWKFSTKTAQFGGKPFVFAIVNGQYTCDCPSPVDTKADGQDHPRTGSPYSDAINVKAVNENTIEVVAKKAGKMASKTVNTVSADGNTLTIEWTTITDNGQVANGKTIAKRVAPGPAGSHRASGSWMAEKIDSASDNFLSFTFKADADSISMSSPTGVSYSAKFDGKDYPYKGDPGTTSVSVRKIDANTVEETDKRDGKPISVSRMAVSADGKSMVLDNKDLLDGSTAKFDGKKQ